MIEFELRMLMFTSSAGFPIGGVITLLLRLQN
jgi:hypothetical protein